MASVTLFHIDEKDRDLRLQLPESSSFELSLIDHDSQECRIILIDELSDSYIDSNIFEISGLRPELWSLDPALLDKEELNIRYSDGRLVNFPLGRISLEFSPRSRMYEKKDGISYAVDDSGKPLLDATHTPRLAETRKEFHEILATVSEKRLEVTAIGAVFAKILSANVNMDMSGIIGAKENTDTFTSSVDDE